ncbi:hypothetical protein AX16_004562 [Volvariella volvacea WC 439]|nr:hypothetical protein AX16_004562 [Volvariella volvacea WC 439]
MLSPFDLPEGTFLFVTDELASPGDFLLHRALLSHVKDTKGRVFIFNVSGDVQRWKAIATRSNVNWQNQVDSGNITLFDVLNIIQLPPPIHFPSSISTPPNEMLLKPLYDAFIAHLVQLAATTNDEQGETKLDTDRPLLVILDDVSVLEWMGITPNDVWKFLRALNARCLKLNATLIVRHHIVSEIPDDPLFHNLLQLCDYHLEVRSLSSGRSGAVSGEVAVHAGPATVVPRHIKLIPRSSALHYRLTDTGVVFFERGTGGAVL